MKLNSLTPLGVLFIAILEFEYLNHAFGGDEEKIRELVLVFKLFAQKERVYYHVLTTHILATFGGDYVQINF